MSEPKKYREPGDKRPVFVGLYTEKSGVSGYKLLQRTFGSKVTTPYKGMDGKSEIRFMTWRTEDEAQAYLNRIARVRNWKPV